MVMMMMMKMKTLHSGRRAECHFCGGAIARRLSRPQPRACFEKKAAQMTSSGDLRFWLTFPTNQFCLITSRSSIFLTNFALYRNRFGSL